jgi:GT2 family glycosyltransferase
MNEEVKKPFLPKEEEEIPFVSVILLPFDNFEFFERALESVKANTDYPNFEIIISHNPCENEDINKKIRDYCNMNYEKYGIKAIFNKENLYHGPGCMEGVKLSDPKTKYIVLLNDDVFVPGYQLNWLSQMVDFMESHSNAATVTPALYHLKNTIYWIGRKNEEGTHDFLHLPKGDPRLPTEPLQTSYNNMAFCLVRANLIREIPLGQTCPMYGSDSEFAHRIKDKYPEMEHWVIPQIQLYHENIYWARSNRGKDKIVEG